MLKDTHDYCPDYECAAAVGINAGLDQEGGGTNAINALPAVLADGRVTEATVDTAFRRLFRTRILLGMLDPPTLNNWNTLSNTTVESSPHLQLARSAAQQGICLYKNAQNADNQPILPLNLDLVMSGEISLGVIGPNAITGFGLLGNYAQVRQCHKQTLFCGYHRL